MMSREFTKREKILLVVMCVLLLGILYFQFVYKPAKANIKKYDTTDIQEQLLTEQAKATSIEKMKNEMATNKASNVGEVSSYNNLTNEISALNDIFTPANTFNLNFAAPVKDGGAVRRNIDITFSAGSYNTAESIIDALYSCKYRCLIRTVNITSSGGSVGSGSVSGTVKVTFFETLYNATSQSGLKSSSDTTKS